MAESVTERCRFCGELETFFKEDYERYGRTCPRCLKEIILWKTEQEEIRIQEALRPKQYRIIRNAARCKKCNDVIESKHRHDWVSCKCGAIFVDGGHDYFRAGGDDKHFDPMYQSEEIA